jgi:hypothetical protein
MTFALTSSLLGGCLVRAPGNLDADDSGSEDGSDDGDPGDGDGDPGPIDGDGCQAALDILLIIDNSGSMADEQARLASALIDPLFNPLDIGGVDWRLAITTTDVGTNPWCLDSTPEAGAFQLRACNEHLEDFYFDIRADPPLDVCSSTCPYAPGKLHALPTTTDEDPDPKPRPWMQSIDGDTNLPEDIDPALAALCFVPQGINGCGFEQPLEAMNRALTLAQTPGNPESGFLRPHAGLLVVIVTDEADCSHNPDHEAIFTQDGGKTFWTDQPSEFPTSAVCWNAGTSCIGDPAGFEDCVSANYDALGDPAATPEDAVLKPVGVYIQTLLDIEQQKRALDPGADVSVLVIGGLGLDDQLHYADVGNIDPEFQNTFGIGPGCEAPPPLGSSDPVTAIPPVRLREVGAALSSESLASICASSYDDALAGAHDRLFGSCE